MISFDEALGLVTDAKWPEDVFGKPTEPQVRYLDEAKKKYHVMAKVLYPDLVEATHRSLAEAAFKKLSALYDQLSSDAASGVLGETRIRSKTKTYRVGPLLARGDICNLYRSRSDDDPVVLKVARAPRDADLVRAEALAICKIRRESDERLHPYFPTLLESFRYRDGSKEHAVNVLNYYDHEWYTLEEVAQAYPDGLNPKDAAWMWRRVLVALGAAHQAGVVHGAILPEHVIILPRQHGVVLLDWSYSVAAPGGRVTAVVSRHRGLYPSEVLDKEPVDPATDIYMAAEVFAGLHHSDSPRQIRAFYNGCRLQSRSARPDDAWVLLKEYDDLIARLWGPRKFRAFEMPAKAESSQ